MPTERYSKREQELKRYNLEKQKYDLNKENNTVLLKKLDLMEKKLNKIDWPWNINNNEIKIKKYNFLSKIAILLVLYIIIIFAWNILQTKITFPAVWTKIADCSIPLDVEKINIKDSNWNNINWLYSWGWNWSWKTVYYFHGNWWPLNCYYDEINYINSLGYNVIAYDYPWYWESEWIPKEKTINDFSEVFYKHMQEKKSIKSSDLILRWHSIWSAVAVNFAEDNLYSKLVLFSPFESRYDMTENILWFIFQKYLFIPNSFETVEKVKDFEIPVLIIHWNEDIVIPFSQWIKIYENYFWIKNFIELDKVWHNNIIFTEWKYLKWYLNRFLKNWEIDPEKSYFYLNEELKKVPFLEDKVFDLKTDSSLQKFVTSNLSFNSKDYVPQKLVSISSDFIYDSKWWTQKVREETNLSLQTMWKLFYETFWKKITVVSAYRSYTYQKWIKDRWCPDNLCAKAGYSEHQSGLAVDLWEASSQKNWNNNSKLMTYYKWLGENAANFGFHNTYQKWLEIDWYEIEPWHWRYMWVELAKYLKENDLTIAEYYNKNN